MVNAWWKQFGPHGNACCSKENPHCSTAMSTRPACHSEFFSWLFLLWPRLNQNSSWINLKGGLFEKIVNLWWHSQISKKIYMCHFFPILLQSNVLSIILWPGLKFWHWSLYSGTPISKNIDLILVTCQNWWIIKRGYFLMELSQKLWPRLKFWHWSEWCWVPISEDIALLLVTWKNSG